MSKRRRFTPEEQRAKRRAYMEEYGKRRTEKKHQELERKAEIAKVAEVFDPPERKILGFTSYKPKEIKDRVYVPGVGYVLPHLAPDPDEDEAA